MREGELRRLKCTALSGNPLPSLHWFAGGQIVEEGVTRFAWRYNENMMLFMADFDCFRETGASGTFVSAELALLVAREDHQRLYECRSV